MGVIVLDGSEHLCDKCGELVPPHNDIRELETRRHQNTIFMLMRARHCLPVVRDGVTVCPGSPSRAQYLEGQPRDTRAQYPYITEDEVGFRAAWWQMQTGVN